MVRPRKNFRRRWRKFYIYGKTTSGLAGPGGLGKDPQTCFQKMMTKGSGEMSSSFESFLKCPRPLSALAPRSGGPWLTNRHKKTRVFLLLLNFVEKADQVIGPIFSGPKNRS